MQPLPPRLVDHLSKPGEEGVGVHEVEERTGADAHEPYLDQRQKRASHGRIEVRQVGIDDVIDRVHRRANSFEPATAGSLTWTCRIDGSGRD